MYSLRVFCRGLLSLLGCLAIVACGGGSSESGGAAEDCSIAGQNRFVYEVMQDIYLWNDTLPQVDPASFASPEALLNALRFDLDRFSFITSLAEDQAFFGEGQFVGLGFLHVQTTADEIFVLDVYEGSPAAEGGLVRGARITAVDGRAISEVLAAEGFSAALGPAQPGFMVALSFVAPGSAERTETFTKDIVTIPPVSATTTFDTSAGRVGYFVFRNFVQTANDALDDAFASFIAAGVDELVVDLRYNSGGLLTVAYRLADLLGGATAPGQVLVTLGFNPQNSFRNETVLFSQLAGSIPLQRVVFITSESTASASELVINSLSPFVDVVLIGARTLGKPVGQLAFPFCEKVLRPVSFRFANADGFTDFFDGFPPDCAAQDDFTTALGDPAEEALAEALGYLETGACSATALGLAGDRLAAKPGPPVPWRLREAN